MSTGAGEPGSATGDDSVSHRHTCDDGEARGSQGRAPPGEEVRSCGDTCGADAGECSCKAQGMHSNCSSETCIPTPSCRICFQGAEQVRDAILHGVVFSTLLNTDWLTAEP